LNQTKIVEARFVEATNKFDEANNINNINIIYEA